MRHLKLAIAMSAVALAACGPQKVDPTLAIVPKPRTIAPDGEISTVQVFATDNLGKAGTGTVTVTSTSGSLVAGSEVTLADGQGTIDFTCDATTDATCSGTVKLTAKWNDLTVTTLVTVKATSTIDGGTDGGQLFPDSGTLLSHCSGTGNVIYVTNEEGVLPNLGGTFTSPTWNSYGNSTQNLELITVSPVLDDTGDIYPRVSSLDFHFSTIGLNMPIAVGPYLNSGDFEPDPTKAEFSFSVGVHEGPGRGGGCYVAGGDVNIYAISANPTAFGNGLILREVLATFSGKCDPGSPTSSAAGSSLSGCVHYVNVIQDPDAGSGDAITLQSAKSTFVAGTSDSTNVVIHYTQNGSPAVGTINLVLDGGASFDSATATTTQQLTTDATGIVNTTVYVGSATGAISLAATSGSANATLGFTALNVGGVQYTGATVQTLNVSEVGIQTSSTVNFQVVDNGGNALSGVRVDFNLTSNSAAGCTVSPTSAITNAGGVVQTTLRSGNSSGLAQVQATVIGRPTANSASFNIYKGRISDSRLQISCARKTLGALQSTNPPRTDISVGCTAVFADRDGQAPIYPVTVNWKNEAGAIIGAVPSQPGSNATTMTFVTSPGLPLDVTPLVGEPNSNGHNPRDGFVTIIASVEGEETFFDGSGTSNGVTNGKWDPGEYFIDLPEPFVDANDNGIKDPSEVSFTDTERFDCATGASLGTNGVWDGPNGCWDKKTQVWGSTHIVYNGNIVGGAQNSTYVTVTPAIPTYVAAASPIVQTIHNVVLTDQNFNRLAIDNIGVSVANLTGSRGSVDIITGPTASDSFGGHDIQYVTIKATETSPGVFVEDGDCDWQTGTDAGYPATRCLKAVKIGNWLSSPTSMQVRVNGATPQQPAGPPTNSTFELRINNAYQTPSAVPLSITFE